MVVEICANSVASCIEAERGGAQRVELCAAISEGGTTPSWGEIVMARKAISIDLNVIIRPRAGDFLYNELEVHTMLCDIEAARRAGANGVVFGVLRADGAVDMELNAKLIKASYGMTTTFHRAFDLCYDPLESLEQIIELGFDHILTSGQRQSAEDGVELIAQLIKQADGRIVIMPGAGINRENVAEIATQTGAREIHLSARHRVASAMKYRREQLSMGGKVNADEFMRDITSAEYVKEVTEKLRMLRRDVNTKK